MSYVIIHEAVRQKRYHAVRNLFVNSNATNPENAIGVEDVSPEQRATIQRLTKENVIKAVGPKRYFDLDSEKLYLRRARRHNLRLTLVLLAITAILFLLVKNL